MKMVDLTGRRFERLVVVRKAHSKPVPGGTRLYWECLCDCGNTIFTEGGSLKGGKARSCGCLQKEKAAHQGHRNATHGQRGSLTYASWRSMLQRTGNPKAFAYERYGGLGITVFEEWKNSFEAFLRDVGQRPSRAYTIDRWPNPYGNYEPGNVRWANKRQQALNRRKLK